MVIFLSTCFLKLNVKLKAIAMILHSIISAGVIEKCQHLQLVSFGFCTLALGTERNKFKVRVYVCVFPYSISFIYTHYLHTNVCMHCINFRSSGIEKAF